MSDYVLVRHRSGREKAVPSRFAPIFEKMKGWEVAGDESAPSLPRSTPAPKADAYEGMAYGELRSLVAERELDPPSLRRDDLLQALRGGNQYRRRDMQAEE